MINLHRPACKFDLHQMVSAIHCKSTQVHARPGQKESQVDLSSQLSSTATPLGQGFSLLNRQISGADCEV